MRSFSTLAAVLGAVGLAAAADVVEARSGSQRAAEDSTFLIFDSVYEIPQGWEKLDRPDPSTSLHLQIALPQPDHALFQQTLYDLSTPDHPSYGQHLSRDAVRALIKPRVETTAIVESWLESSGVAESDFKVDNEWVNLIVSVAGAESMLNTTFFNFVQTNDKSQTKYIRTLQYSLPSYVFSHISMIHPTTRFHQIRAERNTVFRTEALVEEVSSAEQSTTVIAASCNSTITPSCLRALYNIGDHYATPVKGSLFGVLGFLEQYAKFDALESFLSTLAPYAVGQNFSAVSINGGLDTQDDTVDDDVEANLDIQYAASIGFNNNINFYSSGGRGPVVPDLDQPRGDSNEPYMETLSYFLNLIDSELPQTVTISYGENEQSVPESYSRTVCDMFGQLGLRGVSVLISSGDSGVGSACQTNDGKNTTRFLPIFPAACPYVTSVGGTYKVEPERAVSFSSGGFSDRFPRPAYQDKAVPTYLKRLGSTWDGLYNPEGRGFPDVAAQGLGFIVVDRNPGTLKLEPISVGGTRYVLRSPSFHTLPD